ncbi:MFS transporter [Kribbella sp. NBC_01245]|uniref:MFS transporter n=1 Tax=Kribbella sp. NBC_01245 TaxID=2903578 RepID=UPI002E2ACB6C|nr:MFS transporter [Kribbella sp. NBC_01245]
MSSDRSGWRADLAVLRHRSVRTFLAARFISVLGSSIAPIALVFAVLDISDSATAVGVVLAARSIPQVVLMLVGGVIADRLPRNLVIVVANAICAITQALAATLLVTGHAEIWQLAVIEAVNGAAAAFVFPAMVGILPALIDRAELPQANALAGFAKSSALIGGSALAGVIVAFAGSATGLYVDAATFALGAFLMSRLRMPPIERSGESMLTELRVGWTEFVSHQWVWVIVAAFGLINLTWAACWATLGPVIADDTFGRAGWGVVSAAFGAGLIVGGLLMVRVKPRFPLRAGMIGTFLTAPVLLCLAVLPTTWAVAAAAFCTGIGFEMFGIGWETAIGQHIPLDKISRVSSYDALGSFVAIPLGQLSAGYLAGTLTARTVEIYGATLITLLVLTTLLFPSIRTLPRSTT